MEKQTLGEKTAQMLLEMIQKEGFGPGDKLPTEQSWWNLWEWDAILSGRRCAY